MVNYQTILDRLLQNQSKGGTKPRLLLHSCCGPCSGYVLEYLMPHFDISLLYYNPNIQPREEFLRRLRVQRQLLEHIPGGESVRLISTDWEGHAFFEAAAGLEKEPEGGRRCEKCFRLRLARTADTALDLGCDLFCSTLTVSPHKNAVLINEIGQELGKAKGIKWLPSDFKKREGYKRSLALSNAYGLYRQDYCGCLFSKVQRD